MAHVATDSRCNGHEEQKEFFDTIVEIDETYIGGKPRKDNKHDDNDKTGQKHGRGTNKLR